MDNKKIKFSTLRNNIEKGFGVISNPLTSSWAFTSSNSKDECLSKGFLSWDWDDTEARAKRIREFAKSQEDIKKPFFNLILSKADNEEVEFYLDKKIKSKTKLFKIIDYRKLEEFGAVQAYYFEYGLNNITESPLLAEIFLDFWEDDNFYNFEAIRNEYEKRIESKGGKYAN